MPEARLGRLCRAGDDPQAPCAYELIVGMAVDRQFGPFLLFGQGGTAVEVINDKALALPPLNLALARGAHVANRVFRQLQGYRDRPAAALDDIATVITRLSQLVADLDEVTEVDINPLARRRARGRSRSMRASDWQAASRRHAAVGWPSCPIRESWNARNRFLDLQHVVLRPIRPEDAPALDNLISKVTAEDTQAEVLRLGAQAWDREQLARMTQIDYDREMVFVLMGSATRNRIGASWRRASCR